MSGYFSLAYNTIWLLKYTKDMYDLYWWLPSFWFIKQGISSFVPSATVIERERYCGRDENECDWLGFRTCFGEGVEHVKLGKLILEYTF